MIYLNLGFLWISIVLIFLCWGSFLNVVAYRSICDIPFFAKRSVCPYCKNIIFWYDNIPILSWFFLRGKCRHCKKSISYLYPFIEILTVVILTSLLFKVDDILSFWVFFLFFSALIVSTRTDLQAMVIPQIFSLWLVPVGIVFAFFDLLNITVLQSLGGAVLGYGGLWLIAKIFKVITKKEGLGVGDMELLAMIGAFLGPVGVWFSLFIGSFSGLLIAGGYLLLTKKSKETKIPFGPFLALGATIYFFFNEYLVCFWLG